MKYLVLALVLASGFVAGCDRAEAPAAITNLTDKDKFLSDFDGVWATTTNAGTDDAETVFRLRFAKDSSDFVMDEHVFDVRVVDMDSANQVVTFETSGENAPKEMLTVTRIIDAADRSKPDAPFSLRVTFGNGQFSDLSFVRRLTAQDVEKIVEARKAEEQDANPTAESPAVAASDPCADASSFVDRMTCKDGKLKLARGNFESAFADAVAEHGEVAQNSMAAANKQLDACSNTDCLLKAYADWTLYVSENYPAGSADAE